LSIGDTRSGSKCSPAREEEGRSAAEEPESAETSVQLNRQLKDYNTDASRRKVLNLNCFKVA